MLSLLCIAMVAHSQEAPELKALKEKDLVGELYPFVKQNKKGDKYGYKNADGHVVIKAVFEAVEAFDHVDVNTSVARVKCGEKWGVISRSSEWIVLPQYDTIYVFDSNGAVFEDADGLGFIKPSGDVLFRGLQVLETFDKHGRAWFMRNDHWGVYDVNGKELLPAILTDKDLTCLSGNFYVGRSGSGIGLVDVSNYSFVLNPVCDSIEVLNPSLIKYKEGQAWGLFNQRQKRKVTSPTFDEVLPIEPFDNVLVKRDGLVGVYDVSGTTVLSTQYEMIESYRVWGRDCYIVKKDGKYGLAGADGKELLEPIMNTYQRSKAESPYLEYWRNSRTYYMRDFKNYEHTISVKSPYVPEFVYSEADSTQVLSESIDGYCIVSINREMNINYSDGFHNARDVERVTDLQVNVGDVVYNMGSLLNQLLVTIDGNKVLEYFGISSDSSDIYEGYDEFSDVPVGSSFATLYVRNLNPLPDGRLFTVVDVMCQGGVHVQRCASIVSRNGSYTPIIRINGEIYSNSYVYRSDMSYVKHGNYYLVYSMHQNNNSIDIFAENGKHIYNITDLISSDVKYDDDIFYIFVKDAYGDEYKYRLDVANESLQSLDMNVDFDSEKILFADGNLFFASNSGVVKKIVPSGKEQEYVKPITFSSIIWDGCDVNYLHYGDIRREFSYDCPIDLADMIVTVSPPDSLGMSVYECKTVGLDPLVRYGFWRKKVDRFSLPIFEQLTVADTVEFTVGAKAFQMPMVEFIANYDSSNSGGSFEMIQKQISYESEESIPFQLVETKPMFQGGDANTFSKWVNQRLVYPENAKDQGVQGRVTLQFTIQKDGSLTNVKVLRGVDPDLDREAVRVVSMSPKWTPGKQRDRIVPVTYTFPVIFMLR